MQQLRKLTQIGQKIYSMLNMFKNNKINLSTEYLSKPHAEWAKKITALLTSALHRSIKCTTPQNCQTITPNGYSKLLYCAHIAPAQFL